VTRLHLSQISCSMEFKRQPLVAFDCEDSLIGKPRSSTCSTQASSKLSRVTSSSRVSSGSLQCETPLGSGVRSVDLIPVEQLDDEVSGDGDGDNAAQDCYQRAPVIFDVLPSEATDRSKAGRRVGSARIFDERRESLCPVDFDQGTPRTSKAAVAKAAARQSLLQKPPPSDAVTFASCLRSVPVEEPESQSTKHVREHSADGTSSRSSGQTLPDEDPVSRRSPRNESSSARRFSSRAGSAEVPAGFQVDGDEERRALAYREGATSIFFARVAGITDPASRAPRRSSCH